MKTETAKKARQFTLGRIWKNSNAIACCDVFDSRGYVYATIYESDRGANDVQERATLVVDALNAHNV